MQIIDERQLANIPELLRVENTSKDEMGGVLSDLTHAVYSHEKLYGQYCPVQSYINCPPEKVFDYMSKTESLCEWTYSVRDLELTDLPGGDVYKGYDKIGNNNTKIFAKTVSNREALTVDYHCAWDQGEDLWMIYLNRIVPAELVLNKPGSVVFWQNCRHPYYNDNPYPEKAPEGRPWVGNFWDMFYAGHWVELMNLKNILEYRHKHRVDVGPYILENSTV